MRVPDQETVKLIIWLAGALVEPQRVLREAQRSLKAESISTWRTAYWPGPGAHLGRKIRSG
jgi:hypothetical protein